MKVVSPHATCLSAKEVVGLPVVEIAQVCHTSISSGLTSAEADERRALYGSNTLPKSSVTGWKIFCRQLISPFSILLVAAAVISFVTHSVIDGSIIIGFVVINTLLGFFQEYRAERSIALLAGIIKQDARVMRDGVLTTLPIGMIVPGDVVKLEAGDCVPADVRIIESVSFSVDESSLTGESAPVEKNSTPCDCPTGTVRDMMNCGFLGTTVVSGSATAVVYGVGRSTQFGAISGLVQQAQPQSVFEEGIGKLSRALLYIITNAIIVLFVVQLLIQQGNVSIVSLVLFSVALAVSVIPEALPLVTTLTLSTGALHLAKRSVVLRRLSATQDFGGITVLCIDKTGTLTENSMQVVDVLGDRTQVLTYMGLASPTFATDIVCSSRTFDTAVSAAMDDTLRQQVTVVERTNHIPFDAMRRMSQVSVLWEGEMVTVFRGALDAILQLSDTSPEKTSHYQSWADAQGLAGNRILAVAMSSSGTPHPVIVGCISFADPIKQSALDGIEKCRALGIRVIMLTGDSPAVAYAIGKQFGLATDGTKVVTGREWMGYTEQEKSTAVSTIHIYAGISPTQKYEILKTLQSLGEKVGFLGDGINDAPALSQAQVGIAVAEATDIARESADVILLERDLGVLANGIEDGRKLFANVIKYIKATLISNMGNFIALICASFFISFLPMRSSQLLLVNLLTDLPMIAIAFDAVDKSEVLKPQSYNVGSIIKVSLLLGLISTVFDLTFFALFAPYGESYLQTHWFIESNLTELVLIFSIRTMLPFWKGGRPSKLLIATSLIGVVGTILIPFTAFGRQFFGFQQPVTATVVLIVVGIVGYFALTEVAKYFFYRRSNRQRAALEAAV